MEGGRELKQVYKVSNKAPFLETRSRDQRRAISVLSNIAEDTTEWDQNRQFLDSEGSRERSDVNCMLLIKYIDKKYLTP